MHKWKFFRTVLAILGIGLIALLSYIMGFMFGRVDYKNSDYNAQPILEMLENDEILAGDPIESIPAVKGDLFYTADNKYIVKFCRTDQGFLYLFMNNASKDQNGQIFAACVWEFETSRHEWFFVDMQVFTEYID